MRSTTGLTRLEERITGCRRCPRLVEWRELVSREKRAAFSDHEYWGRPVPGFGDPQARLLIVGLAPAAHGANRTGRMFTGDRSGEWLFRALYRAGFANQPRSEHRDDGLRLTDAWLTAAVRCAPPGNRPTPDERDACAPYLREELRALLPRIRVVVALGAFGWNQFLRIAPSLAFTIPTPRPRFGHAAEVTLRGADAEGAGRHAPGAGRALLLVGSFHPSQQNTFTGRLTESMFDAVWARAREAVSKSTTG